MLTRTKILIVLAIVLIAGVVTAVFILKPWETTQGGKVAEQFFSDEVPQIGRGNTSGNIVNGGEVAQNDNWVFYISREGIQSSIVRVNKNTMEEEAIFEGDYISGINVIDDWVFFNESLGDNKGIHRMRINGTEVERLGVFSATPTTLNIVDGEMYFSSEESNHPCIYRISANGGFMEQIRNINSEFLTVVDGQIYFRNWDSDMNIYKMDADGTELTRLNDDDSICINIYDGWVYYISRSNNNAIYRMRTDGSENQMLIDIETDSINVYDDWIYFNDFAVGGYLHRARIDGTEKQLITEHPATFIQIVDDWIYFRVANWREGGLGNALAPLARIRKDGTNFEYLDQTSRR